jgi:site-specific DNA recombinase
MVLVEEFDRNDCALHFIRRPIGTTPDEALLLQMQGVIAEYERAKITERTRRGKLHKMREGELTNGIRTFGYQYVKKDRQLPAHYKVIETEAEVVRNIFDWYTSESISMRKIAARLNANGTPTVKGSRWHASTLLYILRNSIYIGIHYENRFVAVLPKQKYVTGNPYRKYEKCSRRELPRSEWIAIPCPRIISDEIFELAHERLERNKVLASRNTRHDYLLRGLIFCPYCGLRIQAVRGKNYVCSFRSPAIAADYGRQACANHARFPVSKLDELVWSEVVKLLKKPSNLKNYYQKYSGKLVPKATQGLEKLKEKITILNGQIKRLNSLFIEGAIDKAEHGNRHRVLSDKIHLLQSQFDKHQHEYFEESEIQEMLQSFAKFSKSVKTRLKDADFAAKRFITEQLVNRVILSEKDITIELSAPLDKSVLCTNRALFPVPSR